MIYLDYAATTPMCEEAAEAYLSYSRDYFGNTNSTHAFGRKAGRELESFRKECLELLKLGKTHNLIFTSSASEGNSMAIKSVALRYKNRGNRIITCRSEHPSVLKAYDQLKNEFGFDVIVLDAKKNGAVDTDELKSYLDKNTILVSIMAVNNETGAFSPIKEIGELLKGYPKCFFHVDATQAIGKEDLNYSSVDLLTCSAHKFEGPKGVGMLFFRNNITFLPLISGGSQEFSMRGGTVNLPGIAASTAALKKAIAQVKDQSHFIELMNEIKAYIRAKPEYFIQNSPESASNHILNFSFVQHKASVILEALSEKDIFVSSISACSSKGEPISSVLLSMGLGEEIARNSIRVSIGRTTTKEDIEGFMSALDEILKEVRHR